MISKGRYLHRTDVRTVFFAVIVHIDVDLCTKTFDMMIINQASVCCGGACANHANVRLCGSIYTGFCATWKQSPCRVLVAIVCVPHACLCRDQKPYFEDTGQVPNHFGIFCNECSCWVRHLELGIRCKRLCGMAWYHTHMRMVSARKAMLFGQHVAPGYPPSSTVVLHAHTWRVRACLREETWRDRVALG